MNTLDAELVSAPETGSSARGIARARRGRRSGRGLAVVRGVLGLTLALAASSASAGDWSWWPFAGWGACQECGPCGGVAGTSTPYGDTGCGPKYCGAIHDDPCGVDPCDSCNRWQGCNGAREQQERLAPWQLPPGRGFRNAAEMGYLGNGGGGTCVECARPWYRLW